MISGGEVVQRSRDKTPGDATAPRRTYSITDGADDRGVGLLRLEGDQNQTAARLEVFALRSGCSTKPYLMPRP